MPVPVPAKRRSAARPTTGPVEVSGDPAATAALAAAFEAGAKQAPDRFTHGFHAYPARLQPDVARVLVDRLGSARSMLLDPFCGSGTVLIEGVVHGMTATGVDLSPLALRVSELKLMRPTAAARRGFRARAQEVAELSTERIRARALVRAPIPKSEARWYAPHVLRELAGLWDAIEHVEHESIRCALEMVFSAILVKFSKQAAETVAYEAEKRLRKGLATEFFFRKCEELGHRWEDLDRAWPQGTPRPRLVLGDARELPRLLQRDRFDLVVTSPPYGGTYDYAALHARRYAWLGLRTEALERGEIGARRQQHDDPVAGWDRELADVLRAIRAVCRPRARIILVLGDGAVGGRFVAADVQLRGLAPRAGLDVVAIASQRRPDPRADERRREHIVLLGIR